MMMETHSFQEIAFGMIAQKNSFCNCLMKKGCVLFIAFWHGELIIK